MYNIQKLFIMKIVFINFLVFAVMYGEALKVNVEGTVSLGEDVMDTIKHYLNVLRSGPFSRRSGSTLDISFTENEHTPLNVCKELKICKTNFLNNDFLEKYLNNLFSGIQGAFNKVFKNVEIFTEKKNLDEVLKDVKQIMIDIDIQSNNPNQTAWLWIRTIKLINARFQFEARTVLQQFSLEKSEEEKNEIERNLTHAILPQLGYIENSAESLILKQMNLLGVWRFYVCTNTINEVLKGLLKLDDKKIQVFLKEFFENLYYTKFSTILRKSTSTAMQNVIIEMTYTTHVNSRQILSNVQKIVEDRWKVLTGSIVYGEITKEDDFLLFHSILSDLDHQMFSAQALFTVFLENFNYWMEKGGDLKTMMRPFVNDVSHILENQSTQMRNKLAWNTKVFLENTIE